MAPGSAAKPSTTITGCSSRPGRTRRPSAADAVPAGRDAPGLGLFFPAPLWPLLPIGQVGPLPLQRLPLLARPLELGVVAAVEQDQGAGVAVEAPRLRAVDQEQGVRAV